MIREWKKIKEESYKAGFRKMLRKFFVLPDGRKVDFDIKDENNVVCVLAITDDNKVILAKQFRPGPEKVLLDMVGGFMSPTEDPLEAGERELLEETGYAGEASLVGKSVDCAYSNRNIHTCVITNCKKVQEPQLDDNEFIEIELMSLEDFRKHLRSGQLTDVECGYLGLDYLGVL